jgi:hypothetical protein
MERRKEMKIKIERKSPQMKTEIFEIENQTLVAEPHQIMREKWVSISNLGDILTRTPMEGTLEISAI